MTVPINPVHEGRNRKQISGCPGIGTGYVNKRMHKRIFWSEGSVPYGDCAEGYTNPYILATFTGIHKRQVSLKCLAAFLNSMI